MNTPGTRGKVKLSVITFYDEYIKAKIKIFFPVNFKVRRKAENAFSTCRNLHGFKIV